MHRHIVLLTAAIVVVACGGEEAASSSAAGTAVINMLDRQWQISGTCEKSGNDITFVAPGDPMLSIGVNSAGEAPPVGNFSVVSEGIPVIIGSPELPMPIADINGQSFEVSGTFLALDETRVDGSIKVDCG